MVIDKIIIDLKGLQKAYSKIPKTNKQDFL